MAGNLLELAAKISLDSQGYEQELDTAEKKTSSFGDKLKNGFATASKVATAAVSALATGVTAFYGATAKGIKDVATLGDTIDKASQKMGISAEAYQEWDFILQHSGASVDSLKAGMKTLSGVISDAAAGTDTAKEKLAAVGLTIEELNGLSQEEQLSVVVSALQNMEASADRTTASVDLLGRAGTEMGALLNMSAADTDAMRQSVHKLGGVMSDEAVKASAEYADSVQDLGVALTGFKNGSLAQFLPSVNKVIQGITKLFSGDDGGIKEIQNGIEGFTKKLSELIPKVMTTGGEILSSFVGAVVENLPTVLQTGASVIGKLVDGVLQNAPQIVSTGIGLIVQFATSILDKLPDVLQAGIEIIGTLMNGIAEALPELIPKIVEVILKIAETLTDPENLTNIINAAIEIILALVHGLLDAIPTILEQVPTIISNIVEALIINLPSIIAAGVEILMAIITALTDPDAFKAILKGIIQVVGAIVDAFKDPENQETLKEAGHKIIDTFIEGIKKVWENLKKTGEELWEKIKKPIIDGVENAKNWGKDMINNFVGGIKEKWENLKGAVSNVAQGIKDLLGFSEPKEGPLSNFHTYAPDMMELFAKGIRDNEDLVSSQIERSFDVKHLIVNKADGAAAKGVGGVTMNIYAQAQTPADLLRETRSFYEREALLNV